LCTPKSRLEQRVPAFVMSEAASAVKI
jgi:hypothetical protein